MSHQKDDQCPHKNEFTKVSLSKINHICKAITFKYGKTTARVLEHISVSRLCVPLSTLAKSAYLPFMSSVFKAEIG